jgi:hypothetical protein
MLAHQFHSGVAKEPLQQLRHKGETPSTKQKERKHRELEDGDEVVDDYYYTLGDDNSFPVNDDWYDDQVPFGGDDYTPFIGDDWFAPVDDIFFLEGDDWFIPSDDIYFVDPIAQENGLIDEPVHYDDYYYQRSSKKGSKKGKGGKKSKKGKKSGKKGGGGGV